MAIQQEEKEIRFEAFLNWARGFCHRADILLKSADRGDWPANPIYVLYFHAAELALKGFLVFSGVKASTLKKGWGHDIHELYAEAVARGLTPPPASTLDFSSVISLLQSGNEKQGFRYFNLGSGAMPEIGWTSTTVNMLVELVEKQTGYLRGKPGPAVKGFIVWSQPKPIDKSVN